MPDRRSRYPLLAKKKDSQRPRLVATVLLLVASLITSLRAPGATAPAADDPPPAAATQAAPVTDGNADAASESALLVKMADADFAGRKEILEQLARTGDQRLDAIFGDFNEGSLYAWQGRAVTCEKFETDGGKKVAPLIDPFTRQPILINGKPARVPAGDVKLIDINRRDRVVVRDVTSLLRLSNPDKGARLAAVIKSGEGAVENNLAALQALQQTEKVAAIQNAIKESISLIMLSRNAADPETKAARIAAAQLLGNMSSGRALPVLKDLYDPWSRAVDKHNSTIRQMKADIAAAGAQHLTPEQIAKLKADLAAQQQELADLMVKAPEMAVYKQAMQKIEHWQSIVEWIGVCFSGLSAASILILMALGLSIIFGLMGVINMAHGEFMMIGAFATFCVQQMFAASFPNAYFLFAIPVSFAVAAVIGMFIEATVIRFLYGRPLDTLLATLGISYVLIQMVRLIFSNSISVNSPPWLQGSVEVIQDVRLPYNRIFIIGFCIACIALMYFIVEKTKLGLLLRATTQNRTMAASLGVSTRRIDMLTFGLGSGLAGMAGCALTQIGGVTPDMGQNYVVDSFLVVVVGGVGKLAGAIWSGLGLGVSNKLFESLTGAVWGKVIILVLVVAFIQRKPTGLFPAKGRHADV